MDTFLISIVVEDADPSRGTVDKPRRTENDAKSLDHQAKGVSLGTL